MIDLLGFRVQFGRSRFADFRMALGGSGFEDKEKASAEDATRRVFNWAAHASVGFGTVKLGLGMVFNNRSSFDGDPARRLRVIVGADLLKLITGRNIELL